MSTSEVLKAHGIAEPQFPEGIDPAEVKLPKFSPDELLGRTFLRDGDHGLKYRAKIVKAINDRDAEQRKSLKFLLEIRDGEIE